MHRIIIGLVDESDWSKTANYHVDHVNGNGLDNRRRNLRIVSVGQNSMNRRHKAHGYSKYKGVSFRKDNGKWVAQIKINGVLTHLGQFGSEEEAAVEYDKHAVVLFGEHASVNFKE